MITNSRCFRIRTAHVLTAFMLSACGETAPPTNGADSPDAAAMDGEPGSPDGMDASVAEGYAEDPRLAAARAAALSAANGDARCNAIAQAGNPPGFYWEIGDATQVLASGMRGSYGFDTVKTVASVTKLVTAAYFVERLGGVDTTVASHLNFTSGYAAAEKTCASDLTVQQCHDSFGGDAGFDSTKVGRFYYGPVHMQKLAVSLPDLAPLGPAALAGEFARVLRLKTPFTFKYAALASGIEAGPRLLREFMQKLVAGQYKLREYLGKGAQCTRNCGGETYSPVDEPWHYGLGHWVEDGAKEGLADGAFAGLGGTGFYVWIDASKRYYGLLGRWASPLGGDVVPEPSAYCGQKIRAAFLDAIRQSAAHCGNANVACSAGQVCCSGQCAARCDRR